MTSFLTQSTDAFLGLDDALLALDPSAGWASQDVGSPFSSDSDGVYSPSAFDNAFDAVAELPAPVHEQQLQLQHQHEHQHQHQHEQLLQQQLQLQHQHQQQYYQAQQPVYYHESAPVPMAHAAPAAVHSPSHSPSSSSAFRPVQHPLPTPHHHQQPAVHQQQQHQYLHQHPSFLAVPTSTSSTMTYQYAAVASPLSSGDDTPVAASQPTGRIAAAARPRRTAATKAGAMLVSHDLGSGSSSGSDDGDEFVAHDGASSSSSSSGSNNGVARRRTSATMATLASDGSGDDDNSGGGKGKRRKKRANGEAMALQPARPLTALSLTREQTLTWSSAQLEELVGTVLAQRSLTADEEAELKVNRRLIKNRESAAQSRQRRQQHEEALEGRIAALQRDKSALHDQNCRLRAELDAMRAHLAQATGAELPSASTDLYTPSAQHQQHQQQQYQYVQHQEVKFTPGVSTTKPIRGAQRGRAAAPATRSAAVGVALMVIMFSFGLWMPSAQSPLATASMATLPSLSTSDDFGSFSSFASSLSSFAAPAPAPGAAPAGQARVFSSGPLSSHASPLGLRKMFTLDDNTNTNANAHSDHFDGNNNLARDASTYGNDNNNNNNNNNHNNNNGNTPRVSTGNVSSGAAWEPLTAATIEQPLFTTSASSASSSPTTTTMSLILSAQEQKALGADASLVAPHSMRSAGKRSFATVVEHDETSAADQAAAVQHAADYAMWEAIAQLSDSSSGAASLNTSILVCNDQNALPSSHDLLVNSSDAFLSLLVPREAGAPLTAVLCRSLDASEFVQQLRS